MASKKAYTRCPYARAQAIVRKVIRSDGELTLKMESSLRFRENETS